MGDDKKIVLSNEKYPSNSRKAKTAGKKQVNAVAKAKRVKKPFLKRFSNAFLDGEPIGDVKNYIIYDVIIPAAKSTIADLVEGAIDMVLFGGTRSRRGGGARHIIREGGKSYVAYNSISSRGERDRGGRGRSRGDVGRHDFSDIVFDTRGEAEGVLDELARLIEQYNVATVGDFYEAANLSSSFTDNAYGWYDIEGSSVVRIREGYIVELPRPRVLD